MLIGLRDRARRARGLHLRRRHPPESQRPQLTRDRHHHLYVERPEAGGRPADGRPRVGPDDQPLCNDSRCAR